MLRFDVLTGLALCLSCFMPACSDVDRDPAGTGGNGAAFGDDGGSGAGKGSQSSNAEGELCDKFCETTGLCFPDCLATCRSFQAPPCEAEGTAFVKCLADPANWDSSSCELKSDAYDSQTCSDATASFPACRRSTPSTGCAPAQCAGDANHCGCVRECDGGKEHAICDAVGELVTCDCFLSSIKMLTCTFPPESNGDNCNLETGCCGFAFGYN